MEIYQTVQSYLTDGTMAQTWPELGRFIAQACARHDRNWLLPVLAGEALGAARADLVPAAAAIGCLQMQIIAIDDMLDADPRGLHHELGMPATANLAMALGALANEAICRSQCSPDARQSAIAALTELGLRTSYGQHLDTLNLDTEEGYWATVNGKSMPFFAIAFQMGAVLAGADMETASQLRRLGGLYGEIIQIFDDVHDAMARPANPDWLLGRLSLPILFAQTVVHPHRDHFIQICPAVADPAMLEEAQEILIGCGAVSYCVDQIVMRHRQARRLLDNLRLPNRAGLGALLDEVIQPVNRLLHLTEPS